MSEVVVVEPRPLKADEVKTFLAGIFAREKGAPIRRALRAAQKVARAEAARRAALVAVGVITPAGNRRRTPAERAAKAARRAANLAARAAENRARANGGAGRK